jgi:hypothetical protein
LIAVGQCSTKTQQTSADLTSVPSGGLPVAGVDAQPTAAPQAPTPGSQWLYSHDDDQMSAGKIHHAMVISTNTVEFDFPYGGAQHGALHIRRDGRHGLNVMLSIERGQILCHSFEECSVLVRFDDGEAKRFSGVGPADNSTETVFIEHESRFMKELAKAKRVRISVEIYQQGAPVFDFDVSGFDPEQLSPKARSSRPAATGPSAKAVSDKEGGS